MHSLCSEVLSVFIHTASVGHVPVYITWGEVLMSIYKTEKALHMKCVDNVPQEINSLFQSIWQLKIKISSEEKHTSLRPYYTHYLKMHMIISIPYENDS